MIIKKSTFPTLVSIQRIWDLAPHNAFTDLILFQDKWFCVFREGEKHVGGKSGIIRLICSLDAINWFSVNVWEMNEIDLRDPKLSITPDGRLMLLLVGSTYNKKGKLQSFQSYVSFSKDAIKWNSLKAILSSNEWLWRVTWNQNKAYGISYRFSDLQNFKKEWLLSLYESDDGIKYHLISDLNVPGHPNESTVRFLPSGDMVALVRRDKKHHNQAWIGMSSPPFNQWQWVEAQFHLGGPNFIVLPDGSMLAAGRYVMATPYGKIIKTVVTSMETGLGGPLFVVPSHGDTSYPGLVYHDGFLWMSYYSSHEEKTAIYLAKIKVS